VARLTEGEISLMVESMASPSLNTDQYPWISIICGVIFVFVALRWTGILVFSRKRDPREPPEVAPRIPIIGHVLGLQKDGNLYTSKLMYGCCERLFV
jgi:hypothetical protein